MFGFFKRKPSPENVVFLQNKNETKKPAIDAKADFLAGFETGEKLPDNEVDLEANELNEPMIEVGASERKLKGEDSMFANEKIIAVADGLSTPKGGEIASSLAIEEIKKLPDLSNAKKSEAIAEMTKVIESARYNILKQNLGKPENEIPKTTLSAVSLFNHGREAVIGHIGDSSVCLLRDGKITRLTAEHSNLNELESMGLKINYDENDEDSLDRPMISMTTDSEGNPVVDKKNSAIDMDALAKDFDSMPEDVQKDINNYINRIFKKNPKITVRFMRSALNRALGSTDNFNKSKFEVKTIILEPEDVLLSFTDGLDKGIRFEEIEKMVNENKDKTAPEIAEMLAQKGTEKDDVSVAVMKIGETATELAEEDLEEIAVAI